MDNDTIYYSGHCSEIAHKPSEDLQPAPSRRYLHRDRHERSVDHPQSHEVSTPYMQMFSSLKSKDCFYLVEIESGKPLSPVV